jgi:hypothetical protein
MNTSFQKLNEMHSTTNHADAYQNQNKFFPVPETSGMEGADSERHGFLQLGTGWSLSTQVHAESELYPWK